MMNNKKGYSQALSILTILIITSSLMFIAIRINNQRGQDYIEYSKHINVYQNLRNEREKIYGQTTFALSDNNRDILNKITIENASTRSLNDNNFYTIDEVIEMSNRADVKIEHSVGAEGLDIFEEDILVLSDDDIIIEDEEDNTSDKKKDIIKIDGITLDDDKVLVKKKATKTYDLYTIKDKDVEILNVAKMKNNGELIFEELNEED